jgi:glucan 1,3-beta-glucosidase
MTAVSSKAITGTNIGGWMVLEPWISPSLFYRFLNKGQKEAAMDSYSLCTVLGPVEGNKLMRAHWDSFYTEDHIAALAKRGVEMVRLPIGDWTLTPYGPYIGCMDGAEDKIQWMYDTCEKYGIKIMLDVHAMKDSQNGFDNSGKTSEVRWTDDTHFTHWPNAKADWIGDWDVDGGHYNSINYDNLMWSTKNSEALLVKWGSHPAHAAF